MTTIFVDTVGLLAVWNTRDQWHQPASEAYARTLTRRCFLVTTPFVLAECANAVARTEGRRDVIDARDSFEVSGGLIWPTEKDWSAAWAAYARGEAADAGLVDHLSFQVMRRLGVTEAFTNDRHFNAAGFQPLF